MIEVSISFRLEHDDRFTVITERPSKTRLLITETTYEHEDAFLRLLIAADLEEETTRELVVGVLLAVSKPGEAGSSVAVWITPEQNVILGLRLAPETPSQPLATCPVSYFKKQTEIPGIPTAFVENSKLFYDFLMNSPTPIVMVEGPTYVFVFINQPYLQILGKTSADQVLGRPILEALPESKGQVCYGLLERAYKTGQPQVRRELANTIRLEETGLLREVYFDIVYHPVKDAEGNVSGVMAQATDVTERVLARQVSENREQKLYRLWAELETIYAVAPVGIAVIDAADLRLLRLNRIQAQLLGAPMQELVNERLEDVPGVSAELLSLVQRAAAGEKIVDVTMDPETNARGRRHGPLSVSMRASLNPVGEVETVTLITLDIQECIDKGFALSSAAGMWFN